MRLLLGVQTLLVSVPVLLVGACNGESQFVASKYVKTATIGPAGGTLSVDAADDPMLAGTSIVIPAHALSVDTTISIGASIKVVAPAGTKAVGPVVDFEPSGTVFAVPVTTTIPVTVAKGTAAASLFIEAMEADNSTRAISVQSLTDGLAAFQVSGFTSFGGCSGEGEACSSNADCMAGLTCTNGQCASDASDGGSPIDAAAAACVAGETPCGSACVTLSNDPLNCGVCGAICGAGETCANGVCGPLASDGGSPTDAASAVDAASATDAASAVDAGSAFDAPFCGGGETACGGECVNLSNDPLNCGECGAICGSLDGGQQSSCTNGVCGP